MRINSPITPFPMPEMTPTVLVSYVFMRDPILCPRRTSVSYPSIHILPLVVSRRVHPTSSLHLSSSTQTPKNGKNCTYLQRQERTSFWRLLKEYKTNNARPGYSQRGGREEAEPRSARIILSMVGRPATRAAARRNQVR